MITPNTLLSGLLCAVFPAVALAQTVSTTQPAEKSPQELLQSMLKPAGDAAPAPLQPIADPPAADRPAIGSTTAKGAPAGTNAVAPGAPAPAVMREGTFIVDRVGRLTRSNDGANYEFSFEADGKALQDPPVGILPNLKLMGMENAVSASSRDLTFRVTGMVTEYRGRNYVMIEKFVVVSDR